MVTPKTSWIYSSHTEALRILHTAHQVANGFYRLNGFVVVPESYKGDKTHLVILPDLPYIQIPHFWDKVKRLDIDSVPIDAPDDIVKPLEELLHEFPQIAPDFTNLMNLWDRASLDFFDAVYNVIPELAGCVKNIFVYPTATGTNASFNRVYDFPCDVHVHLRVDSDIFVLASSILIALTRSKVYTKYKGLWSESQLLVDWLVEETPIHNALSKYQTNRISPHSMTITRDYFDKHALELSDEFYTKLGLPRFRSQFKVEANVVKLDGKPMRELSQNEFKLLSLLIEHRGEVVCTSAIADVLFSDDNEFSLYAIAKNVERLRKKLEFNGVTGSYIKTIRGEGYLLS